jgi:hypothetical protein
MQIHRELSVTGDPAKLDAFGEDIRRSLRDGWTQDAESEAYMLRDGGSRKVYCFTAPKRPRRPAATIFLVDSGPGKMYVANAVPQEKHQLSRSEYNSLLEEFFRQFVEPAATRTGVKAELTEPSADLERWLSPDAAEKLRRFSTSANKNTGSSHPSDRDLWYDFLVAAEESSFSASMLERWLVEVDGWSEEMAGELAIEYEFGRGLLTFANGRTVEA